MITRTESPTTAADLALALRTTPASALVVVVTGAGVSAASGLPTFRSGPDAIWRRDDLEIGTGRVLPRPPGRALALVPRALRRHPRRGAEPGPPRPRRPRALAAASARAAASCSSPRTSTPSTSGRARDELIKIHGSADRLRCSRTGCRLGAPAGSIARDEVDLEPFRRQPSAETLPRCPECGSPLRAHALFFDEVYDGHADYGFERAQRAFEEMSLALFVGTSFAVGITEIALRADPVPEDSRLDRRPGGGGRDPVPVAQDRAGAGGSGAAGGLPGARDRRDRQGRTGLIRAG